MIRLLGLMVAGGLVLVSGSVADAQVTFQLGRGGSPSVTLGQPNNAQQYGYNQNGYSGYAQPGYAQPGYAQPGYYPQPGYAQPGYAQPGYYPQAGYAQSGYAARTAGTTYYSSGYSAPGYAAPGYTTYPSQGYYNNYNNGYAPAAQPRTGVILNGRTYSLPR